MTIDIEGCYRKAIATDEKPKKVISESIRQKAKMRLDHPETLSNASALAQALQPEIQWHVKQYVCLENASKNYREWLMEDYQNRLKA